MRKLLLVFIIAVLSLVFAGCGADQKKAAGDKPAEQTAPPVELTISAAASLTDSLKEIQTLYEGKNKNVKLSFNFGASGALQQQIEQGAPADLFFSAAAKNLKALVDKQLIDTAKQKNLLLNDLVAVIPADAKTAVSTVNDLTKPEVKQIALGEPESVPAGSYAKESLTNTKLWDTLQPKFVFAKDVRQVLSYVESGNTDAGFVYKTDALTSKKVKVAFSLDPKTYKPIEYPVGIVKATKHAKEAEDFFNFVQSKEAQDVFVKYGFTLPK